MSYVYDPSTGFAQWMADMSFATRMNNPPHGVYGSMYGPREEYEVLRQHNAYQDQHRVQNSPAGIGSQHMPSFLNSSTSRHFPARAASLPGSPDAWDSQQGTAPQQRRNDFSGSMNDRHHSHRDNSVPDHAAIRSRDDRLAQRYAEIGPAAYIEGITIRDSLRDPRLSVPRLRDLVLDESASAEEAYLEPTIARDGFSVPRLRSISPAGPASFSEEVNYSQNSTSRELIHALDEHYRLDLGAEPGHRFDNVDDDIVSAYVSARDYEGPPAPGLQLIKDRERPLSAIDIWVVPISFLHLQNMFLGVMLPIGQETVADLNNDILRVLHIHLSNDSSGIPDSVSGVSVEESRVCVLSELERRGFTEKLPRVARLRGLNDRSVQRTSGDPDWSCDSAPRSKLPNRSRVPVRKSTAKPDVVSKKKKGKAPVTGDQEPESSDHSSDASSSNTLQYELEVSSSQDSTPLARGKVTPAETISCGDSCDCSKKTEHKTDGTRSRHRNSVSSQSSDY
jgi:hypothetical protein